MCAWEGVSACVGGCGCVGGCEGVHVLVCGCARVGVRVCM